MAQTKYAEVADLKEHLGIDSGDTDRDGQLAKILERVSAYIDSYTGRQFGASEEEGSETYVQTGEQHDLPANGVIYLDKADVRSVTSVTAGYPDSNEVLAPDTYLIDRGTGRLRIGNSREPAWYRAGGSLGGQRLQYQYLTISYVYGYVGVPDDIESAALDLATGVYTNSPSNVGSVVDREVESVSVGAVSYTYGDVSTAAISKAGETLGVHSILDRWKRGPLV